MSGCQSNIGRQGYRTHSVQKRVNCILKVCGWRPRHGVYHRRPAVFNFPGRPVDPLALEAWSGPYPCILKAPRHQSSAGGVGHIWTPKRRCGVDCVAECEGLSNVIFPIGTDISEAPECVTDERNCCFFAANTTYTDGGASVKFPGSVTNDSPAAPPPAGPLNNYGWREMIIAYYFQDAGGGPAPSPDEYLPPSFFGGGNGRFDSRCWSLPSLEMTNLFSNMLGVGTMDPPQVSGANSDLPSTVNGNGLYEVWGSTTPQYSYLEVQPINPGPSRCGWLIALTRRIVGFESTEGPLGREETTLTLYWWTTRPPICNPAEQGGAAGRSDIISNQTNPALPTAWPVLRLDAEGMVALGWVPGIDNCGCPCIYSSFTLNVLTPAEMAAQSGMPTVYRQFRTWSNLSPSAWLPAMDQNIPGAPSFGYILHPNPMNNVAMVVYEPADQGTFGVPPDNVSWTCSAHPTAPPCACGTGTFPFGPFNFNPQAGFGNAFVNLNG